MLPITNCALVVRADFDNSDAWKTVCKTIRAPVQVPGYTFYANVEFLEDQEFQGLGKENLLTLVPENYNHSFLFVVDRVTTTHPEFPVLVIDLRRERGREFRAIPSAVQSIENNLSIANMDFFEFADNVGKDGIFRGF